MTEVASDQALVNALEVFLLAETWEGSLAVLEIEPALASEAAIELVGSLVSEANDIGDERSAGLLGEHRDLLLRCRREGTVDVLRQIRAADPPAGTLDEVLSELSESRSEPADMPRRIELCRQGLTLVDPRADPELWALLRAALGTALLRCPIGDRRVSVEKAIEALGDAASTSQLPAPELARALNNLGQAHRAVTWESGDDHLEAAVEAYEQALALPAGLTEPVERGQTLSNLGTAYLERRQGRRPDNLDSGIISYRDALGRLSRDEYPYEWGQVLTNLGAALAKRNIGDDLDEAIQAFRDVCAVIDPSGFPVEWAVARTHMGNALQRRASRGHAADLEEAILAHESALSALAEQRAPIERALTLVNLGNALLARAAGDDLNRAIACYGEALTWLDPETMPLEWAQAQNNLGNAFRRHARQTGSADDAERAIAAYEEACKVLTPDQSPVEYAQAKKNLGRSYAILDRVDRGQHVEQALNAYREALAVREDVYGPDHPRVASVLYSMAKVQHDACDWKGARASLERALAIDEKASSNYPRMASRYRRLATAAQETGDLEAAERALVRALEIDERVHGAEHPDVLGDLAALGNVRRLRGDEPAAAQDLERAVELGAESGLSSTKMRVALAGLADVLQRAGDVAGAERTLERAVQLDEALIGPDRSGAQTTLLKLAQGLERAHETACSEETLRRAEQLGESNYLREYPRLAAWTAAVAQLIQGEGEPGQLPPGHHTEQPGS